METIAYIFISLVLLVMTFGIGYACGIYSYGKLIEEEEKIYHDLYCFECQIEMPVVEKNGRFYCKNCGLYHGTPV